MTQLFVIHPDNPQSRLIKETVHILNKDGVIAYPTDTSHALGCHLDCKEAAQRIRAIRQLSSDHHFTLVCKDLSSIANYAYVDNSVFRLLKAYTPGPYTFILPATSQVPKRLQHVKRKSIGIRIPDSKIVQMLLDMLGTPIMSVSLILPGDDRPMGDAKEIYDSLKGKLELVIDDETYFHDLTSVIDLTSGVPVVIRKGKGDVSSFE